MSEYRDSLPPDVRERYDAAVNEAGRLLAVACEDLRQAAQAGDPDALAGYERLRAAVASAVSAT